MTERKMIYLDDAIDLLEKLETKRLQGDIDLLYAPMIKGLKALPPARPKRVWTPCDIPPNHHDEKQKRLAKIMEQEDILRVEHDEKPLYQTEEDFYAEHPEYKKQVLLT